MIVTYADHEKGNPQDNLQKLEQNIESLQPVVIRMSNIYVIRGKNVEDNEYS